MRPVTSNTGTLKQLLVVRSDGKLYTGTSDNGFDAQGYPATLDAEGATRH